MNRCPVCGAIVADFFSADKVVDGGSRCFRIFTCHSCHVKFDARVFDLDASAMMDIQGQVNSTFYRPGHIDAEYVSKLGAFQNVVRVFDRFFRHRELYVELGVGLGFLTRAAASAFGSVIGLDLEVQTALSVGPADDNVRFIAQSDFVASEFPPISALAAWHVVEHLWDPHGTLGPYLERLMHDGVFFGQVPLFSVEHVIEAHFIFYDERSLVTLLANHLLAPVYFERDEVNNFLSFCFRRVSA